MSDALKSKREELLAAGVIMMDPNAVYAEEQVTVGKGTVLLPGTILRGKTVVGENCTIGSNVFITSSVAPAQPSIPPKSKRASSARAAKSALTPISVPTATWARAPKSAPLSS